MHCRSEMASYLCCHSNRKGHTWMTWSLHRRKVYGINLKVLVAMVTKLCTHFISAMACNVCHAPEIFIQHTSANFEKSKTQIFSNK